MCNKVTAVSNRKASLANTALKNKDGKVLFEIDGILNRWGRGYVKELYYDETRENETYEFGSDINLHGK